MSAVPVEICTCSEALLVTVAALSGATATAGDGESSCRGESGLRSRFTALLFACTVRCTFPATTSISSGGSTVLVEVAVTGGADGSACASAEEEAFDCGFKVFDLLRMDGLAAAACVGFPALSDC